jgi:hypothetical protein
VTFKDSSSNTVLGSPVPLVVIGGVSQATLLPTAQTLTALAAHSIVAIYSDTADSNYVTSTSLGKSLTVAAAGTQVAFMPPTPSSSYYGSPVTFKVQVSASNSPSNPTATTSTVTFRDGATVLGTVDITASGAASYTTTATQLLANATAQTITATYNGSSPNFAASAASTLAGGLTVQKGSTQVSVTTPGTSSFYGQAETFTANVSVLSGNPGVLTGTVVFLQGGAAGTGVGGVNLGSATVTSGKAVLTTTATGLAATAIAGLPIYAVYTSTNANAAGSTGMSANYIVNPASTSVTITPSTTLWATGQTVVFTVAVAATSAGTPGTPVGTVTLVVNGSPVTVTPQTLSAGKATFSYTFPASGNYTVAATYNPTSSNFSTNFAVLPTTSVLLPTTLGAITASPASPAPGQTTTLSVTLTGLGVYLNTGTVTFYANGVPITVLVNGVATAPTVTEVASPTKPNVATYSISVPFSKAATYKITASFSGDGTFNPANSPVLSLTVESRLN